MVQYDHYLHTIQLTDLLPSLDCKHSTKVGKSTLKVVHKHGPCSKSNPEIAKTPNLAEIVRQDQSRVDLIRSKLLKQNDVEQTDAAKRGVSLGTGNYIVNIGLGSPAKELPMIFDTGSYITWARCNAAETLDPAKSTSYQNVSCSSPFCAAIGRGAACDRTTSTCGYTVRYVDGSFSQGFLGTERLTIGSDAFDNFYFGCGQNNLGQGFGSAQGLLGLGRPQLSVVSQTSSKYNEIFSYCLPASSSSTGFLSFGSSQSNSAKYTPLSPSSSTLYSLDMTGISVKGKNLEIPASGFPSSGTVIDSGSVFTWLLPGAYSALRSAFIQEMANYPMAEPSNALDTCFDFSKNERVSFPNITLSFSGGVVVDVDPSGILVPTENGIKQVCLAFGDSSRLNAGDLAIFGNTQQKNYEVVYDVGGGRVGFAPLTCA